MKMNFYKVSYSSLVNGRSGWRFFSICLFVVSMAVFSACEEVGPDIDLDPEDLSLLDTTYIELPAETPQTKMVLAEDFTGATCPNCPNATEELEGLEAAHPGELAIIALFNYPSDPHPDSELSFLTSEAFELATYLGGTIAWPATSIDRKLFAGQPDIILTNEVDNYETYFDEQAALTPPCNIYLTSDFDDATNELLIKVTIKYTTTVTDENHLSIALTESGITDWQSVTGVGEVEDYEHNDVMRTMLTTVTGDILDNAISKEPGRVFEKEYKIIVAEGWVKENLNVVAFVHNFIGDKEVLQAAKLEID